MKFIDYFKVKLHVYLFHCKSYKIQISQITYIIIFYINNEILIISTLIYYVVYTKKA